MLTGKSIILSFMFMFTDGCYSDVNAYIGSISFTNNGASLYLFEFNANKNKQPWDSGRAHGPMVLDGVTHPVTSESHNIKIAAYNRVVSGVVPYYESSNSVSIEMLGSTFKFSIDGDSVKLMHIGDDDLISPMSSTGDVISSAYGSGFIAHKSRRSYHIEHSYLTGLFRGKSMSKGNGDNLLRSNWRQGMNGLKHSSYNIISHRVGTTTYRSETSPSLFVHASILLKQSSNRSLIYTDGGHDFFDPQGGIWDSLGHTQMIWVAPEPDRSVKRMVSLEHFHQSSGNPIMMVSSMRKVE